MWWLEKKRGGLAKKRNMWRKGAMMCRNLWRKREICWRKRVGFGRIALVASEKRFAQLNFAIYCSLQSCKTAATSLDGQLTVTATNPQDCTQIMWTQTNCHAAPAPSIQVALMPIHSRPAALSLAKNLKICLKHGNT
jgi:hypothetical protein